MKTIAIECPYCGEENTHGSFNSNLLKKEGYNIVRCYPCYKEFLVVVEFDPNIKILELPER